MLGKQVYMRAHTQIRNTDVPRQQWYREGSLLLRYTYIALVVITRRIVFTAQYELEIHSIGGSAVTEM